MRMKLSALLAILSITVGAVGAQASVVAFGDSVNVWAGLEHGANNKYAPEKANQDQNGVPDLTGGSLTYTGNHKLTSITLNYANHYMNTSGDSPRGIRSRLATGISMSIRTTPGIT